MSVPLLLDKSSFQGLNYDDIIELHRYYNINITPLIVSEILGDLSKEEKEGRPTSKEHVTHLANKMFPFNAYVNIHHNKLILNSFIGDEPPKDNCPYLEANHSINSAKGKGLVFVETEEEISIRRWKTGEFNIIEEVISADWRKESLKDDVIDSLKNHFDYLSNIKIENHKTDNKEKLLELKSRFEEYIGQSNPKFILQKMLEYFEVDAEQGRSIFYRFEHGNFDNLSEFCNYALYCYQIVGLYYLGINNALFGERKTNLVDLEYLFYLPFTKVFTTNDKFLIRLFNAINSGNIHFISLPELKEDLGKFKAINTSENWSKTPPDKNTQTFKIWDTEFDLELTEKLKPTQKDHNRAMERLREILDLQKNGENEGFFEGEPDFLIKKSYMSLDDPCVCGSGKKLRDCHGKQKLPSKDS